MRPVVAGLIRFESLIDGTLDLEHVALLNATLDVKDENERRWKRSEELKASR